MGEVVVVRFETITTNSINSSLSVLGWYDIVAPHGSIKIVGQQSEEWIFMHITQHTTSDATRNGPAADMIWMDMTGKRSA